MFVERKTHRESWTGDESVKERFALPAELVVPFLQGKHTWEMEKKRLTESHAKKNPDGSKKMSSSELEGIRVLFSEVQAAAEAKQLQPTLRTVYMRTAFQVPYDASVRCSLDTSLCMLSENPRDGATCKASNRWFRDPEIPVHRTELTRFPHAVLEIKLALDPGEDPPAWVDDLIRSGCLTEVPKFSKFMHGCAVLFPDIAQEVPYWVDDVSLRQSLQSSASRETGALAAGASSRRVRPDPTSSSTSLEGLRDHRAGNNGGDEHSLTHPLLAAASDDVVLDLMGDSRVNASLSDVDGGDFLDDVKKGGAAFRRASARARAFCAASSGWDPAYFTATTGPGDAACRTRARCPCASSPRRTSRTSARSSPGCTLRRSSARSGLASCPCTWATPPSPTEALVFQAVGPSTTHPRTGRTRATVASLRSFTGTNTALRCAPRRRGGRLRERRCRRGCDVGGDEEIVSRAVAGYFESLEQNGGVGNNVAQSSSRSLLGVSGAMAPGAVAARNTRQSA